MSYADICTHINAYQKTILDKAENELHSRAFMDYTLAQLISVGYNDPKNFPKTVKKAYPNIFGHHEDWKTIKANMTAIAEAHNKKCEVRNDS